MQNDNNKKPFIKAKAIRTPKRDDISARFDKRAKENGDKFLINKTDIQLLKLKGATDEELEALKSGRISYNILKIKYKIV